MKSRLRTNIWMATGAIILATSLLWSGVPGTNSQASETLTDPGSDSAQASTALPASGFTEIAKRVTPAVVNITRTVENVSASHEPDEEMRERMEEFFRSPWNPFGPRGFQPPMPPEHRGGGMGSGVIVTPDGYILTNNHVVEGASTVTVTLPDKREFEGQLVGRDPKTDLAVVKLDGKNLPYVLWGDSSRLQVGEYVLAVGNPFGLNSTVTLGIVSALGRGHMGITQYEDFIQTDAAINPGNSGGALVNTKGELVGINTAIFSQTGGYQGVGFAVPTAMGKPIFESLVKTGRVVRGYLGIGIQDLNQELAKAFDLPKPNGALVTDVKEGSPAAHANLRRGDVIIRYQDQPVDDGVVLQRLVAKTPVGTTATLTVVREGREKDLTATVGELPEPKQIARATSDQSQQALTGLTVQDLDRETARRLGIKEQDQGVVVTHVEPNSGPDRAGIRRGDVIRELNRKPVASVRDYERVASTITEGQNVLILVNRRGASLFLSVKV